MRRGVILVLCLAMLPACVSSRSGDLMTAGVGPAEPSAIIRNLNGGLIGRADLDLGRADRERALQAEYRALEYGEAGVPIPWRSGASLSGEVTAAQPYRVGSQDCRSYIQRINSAGGERILRGTACRNPDGSWTPLT